jgi:hypothetical protein
MLATVVIVGALLAGCTQTQTPVATKKVVTGGPTALGNLAAAKSALSTTAPDAKLLVVQTAQAVTPTGTPIWGYIFGSAKTGNAYMIYVANGVSMGVQDLGSAGLGTSEWAKVPSTDTWVVDSDAAYTKALAVSGATGDPAQYIMGFEMYKAAADTSTIEPFTWIVQFDPGKSGATTLPIDVNVKTGAASIAK